MKSVCQRRGWPWPSALKKTALFAAFCGALFRAAAADDFDGSGSAVVPGGGKIEFDGASYTNWVLNADTDSYDFIIVYTNTSATDASFTLPGTTAARMLAVGGGGGGGGSFSLATANRPNGGGGGGGAGGLVTTNDLFGAGKYAVSVGAGGDGGVISNKHVYATPQEVDYSGKDGKATEIQIDGSPFITAKGGGAGGGETDGHKGGSGGGGSIYRSSNQDTTGTTHQGGSGTSGQGNAGGAGNANNYGGGGGGAGGAGAAASAPGTGGDGVPSDITGPTVWYAGGGGGGCNSTAAAAATSYPDGIAGGQGGGGKGGVGNKSKNINPTAGVDGTGGGGGGASFNMPGGKGGDGVVIVRIAASIKGALDRPTNVVYKCDGTVHVSYATTAFYTVTGDNAASDVGVYKAVVTPKPGIKWADDPSGAEASDPVTVVMTIVAESSVSGTVTVPNDSTGASVSYYGAAEVKWVEGDLLLKFTDVGGFTLPGTTAARMLAVGGGGGGGGSFSLATAGRPNGGGGGGGAGGFVTTNGLFGVGAYTVSVGAGGDGGVISNKHVYATPQEVDYSGKDGKATEIQMDGSPFITANGGGGGGGETDGHDGASGGGGSMYRSSNQDTTGTAHGGGSGKDGQGRAGGSGNANNFGGGGGGAGGAGAPASDPGTGGDGVPNDITGEAVWYAGGGGGGCNSTAAAAATSYPDGIAGGKGGGGRGGVGKAASNIDPTSGVDGTGGGGGGASYSKGGGKGGSGIFYVRISKAMYGELTKPPAEVEYTYDGNAHTSIVATAFFDVSGANVGTDAGEYEAVATLKDGYTWLDDPGSSVATVKMTIKPVELNFVLGSLRLVLDGVEKDGWTYKDDKTPDPVCDFTVVDPSVDPSSISLVYEYAESEDASEWSAEKPVDAGSYYVRVRTADEVNYKATPAVLKKPFAIHRRHVEFSDLRIRDWLYGTPPELTPNPKCTVSPEWVTCIYDYAADKEAPAEDWKRTKPTDAGTYWLRVTAPDTDNYDYEPGYWSFKIVNGLGSLFTDYVEITVPGWSGSTPATLENFPYRVTLTERNLDAGAYSLNALVGFIYERAGIPSRGDDIAFTDDDGNVLCFYMKEWNPDGDSTVYVKVQSIGAEPQKIRLYWHLRAGQSAPEHNPGAIWSDWTEEDAWTKPDAVGRTLGDPAFSLVYKDGRIVNYWTQLSTISKPSWNYGEEPGEVAPPTLLAEGGVDAAVKDASGAVLSTDPSILPTDPGTYRISFTPNDPDGEYEPIVHNIDFSIYGKVPTDDLSGGLTGDMALTLNGRVLLLNDDDDGGGTHAVYGQAYWRTREVDTGSGTMLTNDVYWTHGGSSPQMADRVTFWDGTDHELSAIGADGKTNVLWRLDNVVIGNGFPTDGGDFYPRQCAMPLSQTGLGSSTYERREMRGVKLESANAILRNIQDAAVYSPCYTNGIGTIYFDVVNSYVARNDTERDGKRIVVEVATETTDGKEPTDENASDENGVNLNANCVWTPCPMLPLKCDDSSTFDPQPKTNELTVAIATEKTDQYFYRVCVKLNETKPVRFRIRRSATISTADVDVYTALIYVDNVIVSYPACSAAMEPYGSYDPTLGGKLVVGQEGAMANVPFPSVGDVADGILARGKVSTYAGEVAGDVDPATFVQGAAIHYRWRYLNQRFVPESGWRQVSLSPFDSYQASEPLDVPSEPGDIEFWYELKTMMPYYSYHDYSGSSLDLGGCYTEETTAITNHIDMTGFDSEHLPSGGTDWFVRLREGASDWKAVSVTVRGQGEYSGTRQMELLSDHTWRGLVKVPSKDVSGSVEFWFEGKDLWEAGGTEPKTIETTWFPTEDVEKMPSRGEVSIYGEPHSYEADGSSTYIEFTYNDMSGTYSIGHAAYQNFNAWHDANRVDRKFVGTYNDKSGVNTADMVQTNANMSVWPLLATTNTNWNEDFFLPNYTDTPGFEKRVFRGTANMTRQWSGDNGMFVDAELVASDAKTQREKSGIAWQMQGESSGGISFTSGNGPSGLDTLTFQARLAQGVTFDDFSVWYGDGSSSTNNYTIVVPALMSYLTSSTSYDYGPGASMSIVAYYHPKKGCYELRIERKNSSGLQFSIYKWALKKYKIVGECVATHFFSGATFWNGDGANKPKMNAMLLSVDTRTANVTKIMAGLTKAQSTPDKEYANNTEYRLISYQDTDNTTRLKDGGSYGVLSASCNGQFFYPRQYSVIPTVADTTWKTDASTGAKYIDTQKITMAASAYKAGDCQNRLRNAWAYTPGRAEMFANSNYGSAGSAALYGIRAPAGLTQTVDVYLKLRTPRSDTSTNRWEMVAQLPVSGYAFTKKTLVVRTNENCHVMMKTGEDPVDVTVWDITQSGWNGADIPNIDLLAQDFVYTQARVVEEISGSGANAKTNRYAMLQPARALASKALSIRSPLLNGLGMIGFSYKGVKPGCEVWVQAATNAVAENLRGSQGYNFSTNSVALGEQEEPPSGTDASWPWITLRKYTYAELAGASAQMHYCGWHDSESDPLVGAFRVVVAPNVVAAAQTHAKEGEGDWGSITITDVTVHDEPAIDPSSWIGYNLRTLGDDTDSEKRMFLPDSKLMRDEDETSYGMSAALNNSCTADIAGDPSEYDKINPTIQSPTFSASSAAGGTPKIGMVRFRARLYETNTALSVKGKVSVYGQMSGSSEDWGAALTNYTVDSFVYRTFEYKMPGSSEYAAVRLVVDGVIEGQTGLHRVLLEEVSVSEREEASVGFEYARPFRTGLSADKEILNILDKDQQPLAGESWGVQAKLRFDKYDQEIDVEKGFRVFFRYFVGMTPWGRDSWQGKEGDSGWAELVQVGEPEDYVFRSTAANDATIVQPQQDANTVVQYTLAVQYYLKGDDSVHEAPIEWGKEPDAGEWTNPEWYEPVDYNKSQYYGQGMNFSPYTILDAVSPGRVWINEVNYNDGVEQQTGGILSKTNQYIEIAVPRGIDIKGWKLVLTDMNHTNATLATMGRGTVPSKKTATASGQYSGDYDFFVLQSPATSDAGGIKDPVTGLPAADGTWGTPPGGTLKSGTLDNEQPYQLELFRPSGIREHQFVLDGTNTLWESWPEYARPYDGTNLVVELNEDDADAKRYYGQRFYAGPERARKSDGAVWSSLGVTAGAHGERDGWSNEMKFTPGRLNEGQDELTGWYLRPNGSTIWVFPKSLSPHIVQRIGDNTSQDTYFIVNSGSSTNIEYTIDPWYAIGALTVNDVTNDTATGKIVSHTLNLNNITETTYVVVTEGVNQRLIDAGLDMSDPYTPAVLNWLLAGSRDRTFRNPDTNDVALAKHKGLDENAAEYELSLKAMYWLDIDPTDPGWWLRHGITGIGVDKYRKRKWNDGYTEYYTNKIVNVKMYLSNDTVTAYRDVPKVYAPYRLQGLANEQSDTFTGNWTSETYKVLGRPKLLEGKKLPLATFTFAPGSFADPDDPAYDPAVDRPYEAKIELLDPYAKTGPGGYYGWATGDYDKGSFFFWGSLDEELSTWTSPRTLQKDSSLPNPPYQEWGGPTANGN